MTARLHTNTDCQLMAEFHPTMHWCMMQTHRIEWENRKRADEVRELQKVKEGWSNH